MSHHLPIPSGLLGLPMGNGLDAGARIHDLVFSRRIRTLALHERGVTDHGELAGLGDDDHPQYTTAGEATAIADTRAAAAIAAHEAAADPHPTYTTAGELAAAIGAHEAAADPHAGYQKESEKAQANGYASLDGGTKVPVAQLPDATTAAKGVVQLAADNEVAATKAVKADDPRLAGVGVEFGDFLLYGN